MSGHTFDVYQEGADLGEALRRAVANARRRRQGHGPGTSGIAQKNSAVPVQDDPVTHIRAISIARDLVFNHLDKVGDQFSNWCGAIPVCDEDGEHVIGWVFAGLYHV
jgi:hypothetical protein